MKRTKYLDMEAVSRRQMMAATMGGCAALTNTSLLSTIFNMSANNSVLAQQSGLGGYKAMVCLFMFGGNDAYNMLSPAGTTPYDGTTEREDYVSSRGGLYSQNSAFLALDDDPNFHVTDSNPDPVTGENREYMIHPGMTGVRDLYNAGKLTFVNNIGSLVEKMSRAEFDNQTKPRPLGLYSHADLQQHWMTTVPQSRSETKGWMGRMSDFVAADSGSQMNPNISMNISLGNVNLLQTGGSVVPYVIGSGGAQEVGWYGQNWTQAKIFTQMTDDYLTRSYSNVLERTFANQNNIALNAAIEYNDATNQEAVTNLVDSHFTSTSGLSNNMRAIVRAIAASGAVDLGSGNPVLNQSRQSFFVSDGGYDNHDELINNQQVNMNDVSTAITSFWNAIEALGLQDDVVLFTASDFARTLNSNGKGSDHAWGSVSMVLGGGLNGGRMYGVYPHTLKPGAELDLGRGRMLPTTSVDELACDLAMWYGVPNDNNMELVLPNIRNFAGLNDPGPLGIF